MREIRTLGSVRGEGHRHYGEPKRARSWKRRTQPRRYLQAPIVPRLLGKRIGHRRPTIFLLGSEKAVRRKRKYDEEFKQQALAMVRNGQTARSVAQALGISENLIHRWKRASRTELPATEQEVEQLRRQL